MKYFAFLILIFFGSCHFYHSHVPIRGAENSKVEQKLLGFWHFAEIDEVSGLLSKTEESLHVMNFNGREYAVMTESNGETALFKVHSTVINNKTFLNIFPVIDASLKAESKYYFFVIDAMHEDSASLRYITDSIKVEFDKSKDLEKFLKKNYLKLDKEWMSAPFVYYRDSYFTWDKVNAEKSTDIEEMWLLKVTPTESENIAAVHLLSMSKMTIDLKLGQYMISTAYLSDEDISNFTARKPYLLKFKNGKYRLLHFSEDMKSCLDKSDGKLYSFKQGPTNKTLKVGE
jgi:hypothetical protein